MHVARIATPSESVLFVNNFIPSLSTWLHALHYTMLCVCVFGICVALCCACLHYCFNVFSVFISYNMRCVYKLNTTLPCVNYSHKPGLVSSKVTF